MQDTTSEYADYERHGARAALYSALAGVFPYPDEAMVADLNATETREGVLEAGEKLGFDEETTAFCDVLASVEVESLQSAHMALFGLPTDDGQYRVVPYEANYTVRDDVSQQQRRIAKVVGAVEALGFEISEEFDERQDHVTVELELMQVLAGWRAIAAQSSDLEDGDAVAGIEATLLDEHLVDFVPAFATAVCEATDHELYSSAANLAEALVTWDHTQHGTPDPSGVAAGRAAGTHSPTGDTVGFDGGGL